MFKSKNLLILLLSGWVIFCLIWFFVIYKKEEKKAGQAEAVVNKNSGDSLMPSVVAMDSNYESSKVIDNQGLKSNKLNLKDTILPSKKLKNSSSLNRGTVKITVGENGKNIESGASTGKKVEVCYFPVNEDIVSIRYSPTLIGKLKKNLETANSKILVTGYTDNVGQENYNYKLGLSRAEAVKKLLIREDINERNIVVASKGEEEPIANNKTSRGRAKNRRVEITIIL